MTWCTYTLATLFYVCAGLALAALLAALLRIARSLASKAR